jgi:16S rRNA (guanine1516-N2)-methyltransferase
MNPPGHQPTIAILYSGEGDMTLLAHLAHKLSKPLITPANIQGHQPADFFLAWRDGCLTLLEARSANKPGLVVDIKHRQGEQRSWPMAKTGALAQALGRKTQSVVDATAGWGQDSLAMFRMGYSVTSIERSPVMAALLEDAYRRLANEAWVRRLKLPVPGLIQGDAIAVLGRLADQPDCIYLDPMFPPKRKKSALAKKSVTVLRELVGDDDDKERLFAAAVNATGNRVVVKNPDNADPLGGKPDASFQGKLLRYDVYFCK